ncbi:hypothetical protein AWB75_04469 [Caballeronia catudaia]|uniref:Uncharacterized protein n=1 Tax=Caballeronia catudaia TaxID=1777136 RepID=A0A158C401_9BURK|nr:hypothetical protein [Caballeronia catudaia]SAK77059.1 hypothetical protein AWB75_04469 [Caballeronia catudaia]
MRERIEALNKVAERTDLEEAGHGYTYREDTQDNRAVFLFDAKPAKEVRGLMKRNAFAFSPPLASRHVGVRAQCRARSHAPSLPHASLALAGWVLFARRVESWQRSARARLPRNAAAARSLKAAELSAKRPDARDGLLAAALDAVSATQGGRARS